MIINNNGNSPYQFSQSKPQGIYQPYEAESRECFDFRQSHAYLNDQSMRAPAIGETDSRLAPLYYPQLLDPNPFLPTQLTPPVPPPCAQALSFE